MPIPVDRPIRGYPGLPPLRNYIRKLIKEDPSNKLDHYYDCSYSKAGRTSEGWIWRCNPLRNIDCKAYIIVDDDNKVISGHGKHNHFFLRFRRVSDPDRYSGMDL